MGLPADDLVDAVAARLADSPPPAPQGATVTVRAADVPDIDPDRLSAGDLRVFVYWDQYAPGSPVSRAKDVGDVTVTVLAVERYTEAGAVPLAWRRARSEWFQAFAVDRLNDARKRVNGYYPETAEPVAFDRNELATGKMFWTAFTVTFRG